VLDEVRATELPDLLIKCSVCRAVVGRAEKQNSKDEGDGIL
jgi:hypothetical protein